VQGQEVGQALGMSKSTRSCEGCTKCCEGWLTATIDGKEMYPGRPCHFVKLGKGCGIYKDRPAEPCKSYQCAWLTDLEIPEWMKPSEINAIIDIRRSPKNTSFYNLVPAGEDVDVAVLSWLIEYCTKNNKNLMWKHKETNFVVGTPAFMAEYNQPKGHSHP
jgi:hypothetical protein